MKILDRFFGGGKPASQRAARSDGLSRHIRAYIDSARTTEENRKHWAGADALSADSAYSPGVRKVLRQRARYEVANNSFARGIVNTLANDTVGTGPRLQLMIQLPGDDASTLSSREREVNTFIEREFTSWCAHVALSRKLRTMRMAKTVDGEAFAIFTNNENLRSPVKLDLRVIESDRVTTPDLYYPQPDRIDGIKFDQYGDPSEYTVLRVHPGDTRRGFGLLDYDTLPASQVIHYFRSDRPEQSRGIPEITPALPLFAYLRRYTLAVISAAEIVASHAVMFESDAPPDGAVEAEPFDTIDIERAMGTTLPMGWKASQLKAEQPTTTYDAFATKVINEIARCLSMPLNIATGNSSGYNYSSGRLDHLMYNKSLDVERSELREMVIDRVFDAWFDEAVLIEGYLPQEVRSLSESRPARVWFWDSLGSIDETKDEEARDKRLANGTSCLAHECARKNIDWQALLIQKAKEQRFKEALGVKDDPAVAPSKKSDTSNEDTPTEQDVSEE